jgi:aldehyde:ferredoxin oxidoreductase
LKGGYTGRMLFVDLSTGSLRERELSEDLARNFLGGYGLGSRILYEMMPGGADPFGPDSILGLVTGPLTGSGAYFGSRYIVVSKSPVNGGWNDANSGGFFGRELKRAGYDAVFVSGVADRPVYLWIKDGKAEIRDAAGLWGKEVKETLTALVQDTGEPNLRAAVIGPAGEKRSFMAAVMNDTYRAAARGGSGAVMGAKKLKAVAVCGSREIPVADPTRLREINHKLREAMESGPMAEEIARTSEHGTGWTTTPSALSGDSPVKNWLGVGLTDFGEEAAVRIGSRAMDPKYKVRKYACANCPLGCGAEYEVGVGPWPVSGAKRPEYETAAAFGMLLLNSNPESIIKCNDICNRYGLDTISTGATIGWAMECYEKGLLTRQDLDGLDLSWGNAEAIVALTQKIAEQEGCGRVLAMGSAKAAQVWGKGAECLVTVEGMELPMHDPRLAPGWIRTYQFDPTPGRHVKGGLGRMQSHSASQDKYNYRDTGQRDLLATADQEVTQCSGLCLFVQFPGRPEAIAEFIEAVTGWPFTEEDKIATGLRILSMGHAFNLREGLSVTARLAPPRVVGKPPLGHGPLAGVTVDEEQLARNFFAAVGWEWGTGKPSLERLRELGGLEPVIRDLYGQG